MITCLEEKRLAVIGLCRLYRVRRLDVFGSAATEVEFDEGHSDLDFLVEFETGVDLGPWLSRYFQFQRDLERLFGRSVDLVMTSALKNPIFIGEVNRTRRPLYEPQDAEIPR
jgi:predicted nucleotidyltransferase